MVVTKLDDEAVLLHLDTKMYFSLNVTGLWIWQQLCDGMAAKQINTKLEKEFDIAADTAELSVKNLIDELLKEQLLVSADE